LRHIKNTFETGELNMVSTFAFFATVQKEGTREVERNVVYYNLNMIISVDYRVPGIPRQAGCNDLRLCGY
jgi:hypothetical protein